MKNFTELVEANKNFKDSVEATDYIYSLLKRIKSPQLDKWSKIADVNFKTKSAQKLKAVIKAYESFLDEIEKAE